LPSPNQTAVLCKSDGELKELPKDAVATAQKLSERERERERERELGFHGTENPSFCHARNTCAI